ncbi:type II toxin-antitoxin system VapB family antitoxin [Mycobacterium botniense]|uniref:Antitoxin n=1 Tax=Mycobacterium botniense TaxID=84962 RepID=A0A7I9XTN2_9MYCO|nr:type II toxin-antitoxin system VapB family antitoxin [Mycobacterium botniense]GFG73285.1 antitoxin [Mycobacterium botniense]
MALRRTTIELDEDLVRAARAVTGGTLRATVERALRELVAGAGEQAATRRQQIADHLARAGAHIDADVLLSDHAWR